MVTIRFASNKYVNDVNYTIHPVTNERIRIPSLLCNNSIAP